MITGYLPRGRRRSHCQLVARCCADPASFEPTGTGISEGRASAGSALQPVRLFTKCSRSEMSGRREVRASRSGLDRNNQKEYYTPAVLSVCRRCTPKTPEPFRYARLFGGRLAALVIYSCHRCPSFFDSASSQGTRGHIPRLPILDALVHLDALRRQPLHYGLRRAIAMWVTP
jgi:hypothetical protein